MFTIYDYAGGLLLIVTGTTLLFMASVVVLVLIEGVSIVARTMRQPKHGVIQPDGKWMTGESR